VKSQIERLAKTCWRSTLRFANKAGSLMRIFQLTPSEMSALGGLLKQICPPESVLSVRRENLPKLERRYGYLPWSHQRASDELTFAKALLVVKEKLRQNGTYTDSGFVFSAETFSP
jgi:hypothetical protein